jgi:hypothetical protein
MHEGRQSTEPVLPFEAEPEIGEHAGQGDDHGIKAVHQELGADLGAHELGALVDQPAADLGVECRLDLGDRLPLLLLGAVLGLSPDQDEIGGTRLLERHLAQVQLLEHAAHPGKVGRTRGLDLEQDATLEVDPVIEADRRHHDDRRQQHDGRPGEGDPAIAEEGDAGTVGNEPDVTHGGLPQSGIAAGRARLYQ